jgi:DNA transformation protein
MPINSEEQEFVSYVVDMMQTIGPVYSKRMFGGHGIFLEGLMFALIADSVLYLKADKGRFTPSPFSIVLLIRRKRRMLWQGCQE